MIYILISVWILLGIHSVWYFISCVRKHFDITTYHLPMLAISLIFPIITHIATWVVYDTFSGKTILFKKKS